MPRTHGSPARELSEAVSAVFQLGHVLMSTTDSHAADAMFDVAIVGGGIAGLLAAAAIGRRNLRVGLFEAAGQFGGRARTRAIDGFRLNMGPHALYRAGAFARALEGLGIETSGGGPDLVNAIALAGSRAERHPLPIHPEAIQASGLLDDEDRQQLHAMLGGTGPEPVRGQPLSSWLAGLRPAVAGSLAMLARLVTYCHAPDQIDAAAAMSQMRLAFGGVRYVDGGWGAIGYRLEQTAADAGASLHPSSPIARLERTGDKWRLTGKRSAARASAVILAVAPDQCRRLVPNSADLAQAAAAAVPVRLVSLDLALSSLPDPSTAFALGFDQPTYFAVHSRFAALAPAGGAVVHAAHYLAPGEIGGPTHVAAIERLLDELQPGWRSAEVARQLLTDARVVHDMPDSSRSGRRASPAVGDSPGLFLAGDWVGEEGLLSDAAAASAAAAAAAAGDHARKRVPPLRTSHRDRRELAGHEQE